MSYIPGTLGRLADEMALKRKQDTADELSKQISNALSNKKDNANSDKDIVGDKLSSILMGKPKTDVKIDVNKLNKLLQK